MALLLLLIPIALAAVALQATVIGRLTIAGGHPDLILVSLVLLTLHGGRGAAILPALVAAPLFDAMSGLPLGTSVLPLLAVVFMAGLSERTLFGTGLGWLIVLTLAAAIVAGLITLLQLGLLGWQIQWTDTMLRVLLPSAVLNALFVLFLHVPAGYLARRRPLGVE